MKLRLYRILLFLHFGRWEYCVDCLPKKGVDYHYWRINERHAKLKPKGECSHRWRIKR